MKLGKNFLLYLRILLQILRAILPYIAKNPSDPDAAGKAALNRVLDELVAANDDDTETKCPNHL